MRVASLIRVALLAAVACVAPRGAIAQDDGNDFVPPEGEPTEDGRIRFVITFEDILPEEISSLLELAGIDVEIVFTIPEQLAEVVMVTAAVARLVAGLPFVKYIEEDARLYLIPPDWIPVEFVSELLGQDVVPYGIEKVGALDVSDEYASNRVVCIIDSGFDRGHVDLPSDVTGDSLGSAPWFQDPIGHGTHVAGTIAAVENGKGVVGVIRNGEVKLHIVRIFSDRGEAWASDAVMELKKCADAGASVVSMSYGRTDGLWTGPRQFEREAYDKYYHNDGMLLVAAAGNDGNRRCTWPACYDSVMSVAAVGSDKRVASFSQYNDDVEIAAPGVDVASTVTGDKYGYLSGTSMATPHVSGVAALVWSHFPELSNKEIRQALRASAEDLGPAGRDDDYGFGFVRADRMYQYLESGEGGGDAPPPTPPPPSPPSSPTPAPPSQTCVDDPPYWVDAEGTGCDWYSSVFLCNTFGWFYENYGRTAINACCSCGGGKQQSIPPPTPPSAPPPPTPSPPSGGGSGSGYGCVDEPEDWTDSFGDGCDWYAVEGVVNRCAEFGLCCMSGGKTAVGVCCVCQGVFLAAVGKNKTEPLASQPPGAPTVQPSPVPTVQPSPVPMVQPSPVPTDSPVVFEKEMRNPTAAPVSSDTPPVAPNGGPSSSASGYTTTIMSTLIALTVSLALVGVPYS